MLLIRRHIPALVVHFSSAVSAFPSALGVNPEFPFASGYSSFNVVAPPLSVAKPAKRAGNQGQRSKKETKVAQSFDPAHRRLIYPKSQFLHGNTPSQEAAP
jgi:hypothetical protein